MHNTNIGCYNFQLKSNSKFKQLLDYIYLFDWNQSKYNEGTERQNLVNQTFYQFNSYQKCKIFIPHLNNWFKSIISNFYRLVSFKEIFILR